MNTKQPKAQLLVAELEYDILRGQGHLIPSKIAKLNSARIPRNYRLPLANICRRVNLLSSALRILTPVVQELRAGKSKGSEATPDELAEYAVLLQKTGAIKDALLILERIDPRKIPAVLLYRTFCYFNRWEYARAVPHLDQYVNSGIAPYMQMVGFINLAAAHLYCDDYQPALERLNLNLEILRFKPEWARLRANCLGLRAHLFLEQGNLASAERDLDEAARILGGEQTYDQLTIRHGNAKLQAQRLKSAEPLLKFREEALARRHWETLREVDLSRLKIQYDPKLYAHLYFGTPYDSYRRRLVKSFGHDMESNEFLLGDPDGKILDLATGEVDGHAKFNSGKYSHRLIGALLKDFYRPLRLHSVFEVLYEREQFNIFSSPTRTHKVIQRTRAMIERSDLPMSLIEERGEFSIQIGKGLAVKLGLRQSAIVEFHPELARIARTFGLQKDFSASEARERLGYSLNKFQRLAVWALENGRFVRSGGGRLTRYRLVKFETATPADTAA